ncbi:FUSC family protein [Shewanella sp. D64]|uniref:FUSC family protein n=1 Tax=unclassified Shewanella TaxID=196818 RepID=UPI0022BA54A3|nr:MULTISPECIES: FUSC family protein [unclassified Shewanella]MEC4724610.1 FUSC family protein [Shewanella sp. D64]MEC4736613.1 FUSC family protein [Shewanella sp. E94]WBJ94715.1 FUSC family protein [Shewanella sp. MTB7]
MLTTPSKDDWIRGGLYAIAMGTPLLLAPWLPSTISVFVTLGAMFTLRLDPRSHSKHQVMAMMGGMLLVISAGMFGKLLVGHRDLTIMALVLISFLAGQPQPEQKYFALLGKFVAAAFVLEEVGGPATLTTAMAYLSGAAFALLLTLIQGRFFPTQATGWSLSTEWHDLRTGHINGPLYGLALPLTVLASILTAHWLNAQHESWVGLTVLFVMNVDAANAWKKIGMRIIGTLMGVICAYLVVIFFPNWTFPFIIMLTALFMPTLLRQNYILHNWLTTIFALLVVDLAMQQNGGDESLIQWRFIDTLIGCAWVAVSLILLRLGRRWWPNKP